MKATGIVRRIDDLGRVVIPKEIRRTLAIREGDPLEIYTTDGGVLFRKYEQPTETKAATAQKWLEDNALPIRPNCKFFGRTKFFYNQTVDIDNYGSIDEAVRTVIANGLEKEAHGKVIDEKWKKWDEKT